MVTTLSTPVVTVRETNLYPFTSNQYQVMGTLFTLDSYLCCVYFICHYREHYFTSAAWVSQTEVSVVWMNRPQNLSVVTLCKSPMWYCQEVICLVFLLFFNAEVQLIQKPLRAKVVQIHMSKFYRSLYYSKCSINKIFNKLPLLNCTNVLQGRWLNTMIQKIQNVAVNVEF